MEKIPETSMSNRQKRSIGHVIVNGLARLGENLRSVFYMGPIVPEMPYRLSEGGYQRTVAEMNRMDAEAMRSDWEATGSDLEQSIRQFEKELGRMEE